MSFPRTIIVAILGFISLRYINQQQYGTSFIADFFWIFILICDILLTIFVIFKDVQGYKTSKKLSSFLLTLVCICITITAFLINHSVKKELNRPVLMELYFNGDINGICIGLRSDGTYIYESVFLVGSDISYGRYKTTDSTITLDPPFKGSKIDYHSFKLMPTANGIQASPIDKNNNILSPYYNFNIIDHRK